MSLIDHHVMYFVSPMVFMSRSLSLRIRLEACQLASSSFHAQSHISLDHALFDTTGILPLTMSCIDLKTPKVIAKSSKLKIGLLNPFFQHSVKLSQKTFNLKSKVFLMTLSGSILRIERIQSNCFTLIKEMIFNHPRL